MMKRAVILAMFCSLMLIPLVVAQEAAVRPSGELLALQKGGTAKRAGNFAYVESGLDGRFYAKSVPDERDGTKGITKVYKVRKDADELIDSYDWYAPREFQDGIVMGWSPIVGKVAVMRVHNEVVEVADGRIELSFYLGGKFLKSYTVKDLVALGVKQEPLEKRGKDESRQRLDYKVLGCEQVPNTNAYRFSIMVPDGKKVMFDIVTGQVVTTP